MLRRLVFGLLFCCTCGVGFGFVIYVCIVAALCVLSIFLLFDFLGVVLAFFFDPVSCFTVLGPAEDYFCFVPFPFLFLWLLYYFLYRCLFRTWGLVWGCFRCFLDGPFSCRCWL